MYKIYTLNLHDLTRIVLKFYIFVYPLYNSMALLVPKDENAWY